MATATNITATTIPTVTASLVVLPGALGPCDGSGGFCGPPGVLLTGAGVPTGPSDGGTGGPTGTSDGAVGVSGTGSIGVGAGASVGGVGAGGVDGLVSGPPAGGMVGGVGLVVGSMVLPAFSTSCLGRRF